MPALLNSFLANLPEREYFRLKPDLDYVALKPGDTLHTVGDNINHVYFPVDCLVSYLLTSREGIDVEVQLSGAEGCVGQTAVLSRKTTARTVVVKGGDAWKLPVGWFREEFRHGGALHDFVLYSLQAQLIQSTQLSLCHRLHSVEERLCRWLLISTHVSNSNVIPVTHETLAQLLGSRRPGVTIAMNVLRQAGLVECSRGQTTVLKPDGLAECSCDCFLPIRESISAASQAMAARGGPVNCSRHLLARQSELLRARSGAVRGRSEELRDKADFLHTKSVSLLARSATLQGLVPGNSEETFNNN